MFCLNSSFLSDLIIDNISNNYFYKFSILSYGTGYYWHVQALNYDNSSLWTNTQHFTTEQQPSYVSDINPTEIVKVNPNPFSTTLNFTLDLNEPSTISIKIYDILGIEECDLISNEQFGQGEKIFEFHPELINDGIYFWLVNINNSIIVGKLIKLD